MWLSSWISDHLCQPLPDEAAGAGICHLYDVGHGKGADFTASSDETLMIGIVSLVVGLVLGVGLSQIMSALVVNMFQGI